MKKRILLTIIIISMLGVIAEGGRKGGKFPAKKIQKIFSQLGKSTFIKGKKGEQLFQKSIIQLKKTIKPGSTYSPGKECKLIFNGPVGDRWQFIVNCIENVEAKSDDGSNTDAMFLVAGKCNKILCSNGDVKESYKGEVETLKIKIIGLIFNRKNLFKNEHYVDVEFIK